MKNLIIQTTITSECMITILKTKLLLFMAYLFAFFSPVLPLIYTTIAFIVFDTIMGLWKATYIGEKRNSNGFKRGFIPKIIIYSFVLILVFVADKLITFEPIKHYTQFEFVVTKIVALVLIFIESWSIDENFKAIYNVSIIDKFQGFLTYLKDVFRKFLDNDAK